MPDIMWCICGISFACKCPPVVIAVCKDWDSDMSNLKLPDRLTDVGSILSS